MRGVGNGSVLREFRTLFHLGTTGALTDGQLLERFTTHRDGPVAEAAFSALVDRHGSMVLSACRHLLGGDPHAADDAFQAVFLILARKARSIRVDDSLGPWLYGVTHRVAARSRAGRDRRRLRERDGLDAASGLVSADSGPEALAGRREVRTLIHEELRRLPEKYRAPIVLCYLESQTHEEAARQLRWPVGTVRGRLARARDLLRRRLSRRGLSLPAAALATSLGRDASASLVSPLLAKSTVTAALAASGAAVGGAALTGLVPTTALSLSDGAIANHVARETQVCRGRTRGPRGDGRRRGDVRPDRRARTPRTKRARRLTPPPQSRRKPPRRRRGMTSRPPGSRN